LHKVFIVVWDDLIHALAINPRIFLFSNKKDAIRKARTIAMDQCQDPKLYSEPETPGWLLYIKYSPEDDYIAVKSGMLM